MKLTALPLAWSLVCTLGAFTACGDDETSTPADTLDAADGILLPDTTGTPDTLIDSADTGARACEPVAQTGCGVDENCTFVANETTASCVPEGPVPSGVECDAENRCERGVCMSINQTKNLCYQFCDDDTDCGTDGTCLALTSTTFKVCKIAGIYDLCGLVAQNCQDATKACYAVAGEPEPICLRAGTGEPGSECHTAGACKKGYACVNDVCRAVCDPDVAGSCGDQATCRDFFDDAGYCQPD